MIQDSLLNLTSAPNQSVTDEHRMDLMMAEPVSTGLLDIIGRGSYQSVVTLMLNDFVSFLSPTSRTRCLSAGYHGVLR